MPHHSKTTHAHVYTPENCPPRAILTQPAVIGPVQAARPVHFVNVASQPAVVYAPPPVVRVVHVAPASQVQFVNVVPAPQPQVVHVASARPVVQGRVVPSNVVVAGTSAPHVVVRRPAR